MHLRIGQRVPEFSLPDSNEKERSLSELVKREILVVVFFPFAFSGVCDREMCMLRDGLFMSSKNIVGISVDSVYTLKVFGQTYNLQFPLLSDFNKKVSRAYGVLDETWVAWGYKGVAKRSTFVVDRKCILRYKWIADDPGKEPPYDEVGAAVSKLAR